MKKYLIVVNLSILTITTFIFSKEFITNEILVNFYSSQLPYAQIETIISKQQKYEWVGYLFIPIIYLLKISLISLCLYTGILLSNVKTLSFSKIFSAVVLADILFLIPGVIKIFWFSFQPDYTLEDLQYFMPGSLLNLFNPKEIEPWLVYPLQSINIWEVAFWFALAYELKEYFQEDYTKSFSTVMVSYGSGFLIWVVFVVFLTLNFS
ncbi:hypothetical protein EGI22_02620 [Lacihabitans sp. LS3-19]|uniref:hypothetical protein n=1 Tax=Lacihabitans sp. LS3-19 TaxID=2487335 RepID=UPI0020CD2D2C|nr:hypothetical protein [Lacihabitans sp. LS3-19]MCP9766785.1 hypothetical protein [Lacihabitans sp. LS3-19]